MRKFIALWLIALLLVLPTSAADLSAAKGSVLMEPESGRVLYENNAGEPMGMASTTKIMTALITLEQPDIDTPFVVDADAIRVEGSSMGLTEGDTVTLRTLAWGMMMHSGNDAANAAAVAIAGDMGRFVEMMNARALEIGMTSSHFMNPSGLSESEHYATAYDMALLAGEALKNADLREMVSSKNVSVAYGNPPYKRFLLNHNRLLWRYPYAIGLKTGFTKAAGRCLVSAAEKEGVTLVCITLGCYDDFTIHQEAYEHFFTQFARVDFSDEVTSLGLAVVGGAGDDRVAIALTGPLAASLMAGEADVCRVLVEAPHFLYAPVAAGDVVGRATVYLDGRALVGSDLVAAETIAAPEAAPTLWERLFGTH